MADLFELDLETFSPTPIAHGVHRYAEEAEILLFAGALNGEEPRVIDLANGEALPSEWIEALADDEVIVEAHNTHFDRTILHHCGYITRRERWRDTMVQALAHSLPGSLGELCVILGVPSDQAKDKDGKALIQLFCKPQAANRKLRRCTASTHPAEWTRFKGYATSDIRAMRAIKAKMPKWNNTPTELALWHLDQKINDRGMHVDIELAQAAIKAVDNAQKGLAARTAELTAGKIGSTTQRAALLAYLARVCNVDMDNLQMATVENLLAPNSFIPPEARELLTIRLQASTTSTSKYQTLINGMSGDGRLRGTKQFCGASRTGRWAGRLFQPDNLPRSEISGAAIDEGIGWLKEGSADLLCDNVMQLTSAAIRGCITAPSGRKLVVSDLSNIEGRVQAWLGEEAWKLTAFRQYDAGVGPDLYKIAYGKSFGVSPEIVTKPQRQIGKVQELALGYQGGVGAFVKMAASLNVNLDAMAEQAFDAIPQKLISEANSGYAWTKMQKRPLNGLSERTWVVCDAFKRAWRYAHPGIVVLWAQIEDAVCLAIGSPGITFSAGILKMRRDGPWLRIKLPSGRFLCYPSPKLEAGKVSYSGADSVTRKWQRIASYGGKFFENICQAIARDILAANMPAMETAGYKIVLTVHDEAVTETPDIERYSVDELSQLLATVPEWASGIPLSAGGFEAKKYRKDG